MPASSTSNPPEGRPLAGFWDSLVQGVRRPSVYSLVFLVSVLALAGGVVTGFRHFVASYGRTPAISYDHMVEGDRRMQAGDFARALTEYQMAARINPSPRDFLQVALAAYQAGDKAASESALRQVLRLNPGSAEALYRLGVLHWERQEADEALRLLEAAVKADPGHARAHLTLGSVQYARGDLFAAMRSFEAAAALDPELPLARENLMAVRNRIAGQVFRP